MESEENMATFIAFFAICLSFFFIAIAILGTVFWIWMLIDCIQNERNDSNDKVVWLLIIIFTHLIGGLVYYFVRRKPRLQWQQQYQQQQFQQQQYQPPMNPPQQWGP
jgi:hypothetical protein